MRSRTRSPTWTGRNRPLADVFNHERESTHRNSETIYRRWKTEALKLPELAGRRRSPGVAEKEKVGHPATCLDPNEHAGILTMPNTIFEVLRSASGDGRTCFTILWCSEPDSTSVKTDEFLRWGGANLRAGGGLATVGSPASVHELPREARLLDAVFQGYLDVRVGEHYEAAGATNRLDELLCAEHRRFPRQGLSRPPMGLLGSPWVSRNLESVSLTRYNRHV